MTILINILHSINYIKIYTNNILFKNKNIYVVTVLFVGELEKVYSFVNKDIAKLKMIELCKDWCNQTLVLEYLEKGNTLDTVDDWIQYFQIVHDDCYIELNKTILK
jgi:hypothetical protein